MTSAGFLSPAPRGDLSPAGLRGRAVRTVLTFVLIGSALVTVAVAAPRMDPHPSPLTDHDQAFLEDLEARAVRFFVEHSDPATGLTRDRAPKDGSAANAPASVAATGFALTAWCIADSRGWLAPGEALARIRTTLRFAATQAAQRHGWLYHFVDPRHGTRVWDCEVSTIDTALFLQGAVCAREYLRDPEITALVNGIYARIDWQWALNGGRTLSHGWRPETGFIRHRWDTYSEHMGLYLLGIGAPEAALPAAVWDAWRRPTVQYAGRTFLRGGPLFTHQYAQAWVDFRGRRDAHADYWQSSVEATLAQRAWFATQSRPQAHLGEDLWGLTASDSAHGYRAWGSPGQAGERSDGTLVPCAPGGSLPFAPRECLAALRRMREIGGAAVWGRYGFADAFNPSTGWSSPDVIGIDVGITLVMAENLRTGLVWDAFMRAPEVQRAMQLVGFRPNGEWPAVPSATVATR